MPLDPQESCAFSACLGNRSVFILDPRLSVMELQQLCDSQSVLHYILGPNYLDINFSGLNIVRCVKQFVIYFLKPIESASLCFLI